MRIFLISNMFKNSLTCNSGSILMKNLNIILKKYNIQYCNIFNNNKIKLHKAFSCDDWRIGLIKELIDLRDFNRTDILDLNEIIFMLNSLCMG